MQSAYCSRFQKIKNLYKKLSFSNYYFEEINFNVFFLILPEDVNRCNLLIAVASKNQEFFQLLL